MGWVDIYWMLCLFGGIMSSGLAFYLMRHGRIVGAPHLMLLMLAVAEWSFAYAMELTSPGLESKLFWLRAEYVGAASVPVLYLLFNLHFASLGKWLNRWYLAALCVVPATTIILAWTNEYHSLLWRVAWMTSTDSVQAMFFIRGSWFWLFVAYSYLLLFGGTALLVRTFLKSNATYRKQMGVMLVGIVVPWLGNLLYISGLSPVPNLDLTPVAFAITGTAFTWGILRLGLFSLVPIARAAALDAMSDAVVVLDLDGRVADLNQAAQAMLGVEGKAAPGRPAREVIPGASDLNKNPGGADEAQSEFALGQGPHRRHFERRVTRLMDRSQRPVGQLLIVRDITKRKQADEQRLLQVRYLENLQRIDRVLLKTGDMQETMNTMMKTIVDIYQCDRAWLLYPCDPESPYWQVSFEYTVPEHPGIFNEGGRWPMTRGMAETIREHLESDQPYDFNPDHDRRHTDIATGFGVRAGLSLVIYPRMGEPWMLGIHQCSHARQWHEDEKNLFRDIAHRLADALSNMLLFEKLRVSEERFRSLSESAPDLIYMFDRNRTITYVNPAVKDTLGYQADELIGKPYSTVCPPEILELFDKNFDRVLQSKSTLKEVKGQLVRKDGKRRMFSMSGAPNLDAQGEVVGVVGICKDMTEQMRLETQLRHSQKMEAVGTLAGGIAHDFNNLLQAMGGYAQLLAKSTVHDPVGRNYIEQIENAVERASGMVRQMLTFSRKGQAETKPVDVNREITLAVNMLERTIPKMVSIETHLEDGLWPINGDPNQIEQVLMNLGANARDAMPEGGRLVIETANIKSDDWFMDKHLGLPTRDYVMIKVADTGQGMTHDQVEHIFEPFYTTKEVGKGTGLGLSTVYGIVKRHGGGINCYSEPGKGSVFNIYLPAAPELTVKSEEQEPGRPGLVGGDEVVMLVDDEAAIREMAKELLTDYGYTVLSAASGEEALDLYANRTEAIDLVVMDLGMPGIGGEKALKELLKMDPAVRVIISSGYSTMSDADAKEHTGAVGFLAKPYRLTQMLTQVRESLDKPRT